MEQRLCTLDQLSQRPDTSRCVITSLSAFGQRLPPKELLRKAFSLRLGDRIAFSDLKNRLISLGFARVETVVSPGEFSVRGEIFDLFPAGTPNPYRLGFQEEEIERLHLFDPETQCSKEECSELRVLPMREVILTQETCERFAQHYQEIFDERTTPDPFFEATSLGLSYPGQEHWLPLFYPSLSSFSDALPPETRVLLPDQWQEEVSSRFQQITDFFTTRQRYQEEPLLADSVPYYPLPPEALYLSPSEVCAALSSLQETSTKHMLETARRGEDFSLERREVAHLVQKAADCLEKERRSGKNLLIACATEGGRTRLCQAFSAGSLLSLTCVETWEEAIQENKNGTIPVKRLFLPEGFAFPDLWVLSEADLWGASLRTVRPKKGRTLRPVDIETGDYVVHEEHGLGQYKGLWTLEVDGVHHDCLELLYDQGDKLYVPVENLDLVSHYGSEERLVTLDRLGTLQWQSRKARIKERIGIMAQKLLDVAAQRLLKEAPPMEKIPSEYDLFCARFPYPETEDQGRAIAEVTADFRSGHFSDRLICGDVGFGKTEVALRAAFLMVAAGKQVAVVVPTTLLCRQHFHHFSERFSGFSKQVAFLSRLTPPGRRKEIREEAARGTIDILIGTHTLLRETMRFHNLGLLIVDEEQHFGVKQKEQLKSLYADVHVLTLTATPIPRTLQLSLAGVRDLSLIASPPIDRRAVHTFVTPFDPVVLREALLRERARGGQTFYVCPHVKDLPSIEQFLTEFVPEIRFCCAHGQMPTAQLESTIHHFLEGKYDTLVATNIIESGIDIPTANTIILHRADLFGLSQLYQLRGRVGRAQKQAYAYFTYNAQQPLPEKARKRLEILERLDHLGAGFTLASFDLDLRGAGNLLGEEQSGHIREVGVELYQNLLQQAVETLRKEKTSAEEVEGGAPQLSLGLPVLIPDTYVRDHATKLELYRRAATLKTEEEFQALHEELIDRFGPLPAEVHNLFTAIRLRNKAKEAFVQRLSVSVQGGLMTLHGFPNPEGMIALIQQSKGALQLRPGDKLFFPFSKSLTAPERLRVCEKVLTRIAAVARTGEPTGSA